MLRLDEIVGASGRESFSRLLDEAFAVPQGMHYLEDFPVWDERVVPSGPRLVRLGVFDGSRLAGCAAVRIADLKIAHTSVPIALIGAVATDPEFRGRGIATQAVEFALKWARTRGATAAFLWGSEHSLYGRLGFELAGRQVQLPLKEMALPAAEDRLGTGWTPSLFDALASRAGGLVLNPSDRAWLEAHRHVEWFWIGEALAPRAYAAIGRGIDLTGMIHEWGGDKETLARLLAVLKTTHPDAFLLGHPEILRSYGFLPAAPPPEQGLALIRIFEPGIFSEKILSSAWIWGLDAV